MYLQNEHDAFAIAGHLEVALGVRLVDELDEQLERIVRLAEVKRSTDFFMYDGSAVRL